MEVGAKREIIYLSLHCRHQNESHFNVSVGSDGQSHKTVSTNHNLFEEKGEPKRIRTEVLLFTTSVAVGQNVLVDLEQKATSVVGFASRLHNYRGIPLVVLVHRLTQSLLDFVSNKSDTLSTTACVKGYMFSLPSV